VVFASTALTRSINWYLLLTKLPVGKSTRPQLWKRVSLDVVLNHFVAVLMFCIVIIIAV